MIATGLPVALCVALGAMTTAYLLPHPVVQRNQLESATLITILVSFALTAVRARRVDVSAITADEAAPGEHVVVLVLLCAASILLYWPTLRVGLLSDDFVLHHRALHWQLGMFNAGAFRPLPLAAWSLLLQLGLTAPALHALSVTLHGVNAWLVFRLCREGGLGLAALAALLFLASPIDVEAVTWPSAIFDVAATTFTLLAILAARAYVRAPTGALRLATFGSIGAGILCKETAVVAPVLVLLDAWSRGRVSRRQFMDCLGMSIVGVLYGASRMSAVDTSGITPSRYLVQRYLFETFAGLALPWHARVLGGRPSLAIAAATIVLVIFVLGFLARAPRMETWRRSAAMMSWLFVCALPVLPFMYVSPDLEGARYLYMSSVGWSIGISYLAANTASPRGFATSSGTVLAGLLVLLYVMGVRYHQAPWLDAASLRDSVLASARGVAGQPCASFTFTNLPDAVSGAFVFRNGFEFAVQELAVGRDAPPRGAPCVYRWDPAASTFILTTSP